MTCTRKKRKAAFASLNLLTFKGSVQHFLNTDLVHRQTYATYASVFRLEARCITVFHVDCNRRLDKQPTAGKELSMTAI